MKELIEKRKQLIEEYDAIKKKASDEKRSVYNNDERTKVNELKLQLDEIDSQIDSEKAIEEKRSKKIELLTINTPNIVTNIDDTNNDLVQRTNQEFVKYLKGEEFADEFRSKKGNFKFSNEYFEKRATVTKAGDSSKFSQILTNPVSIIEKQLVLDQLGAPAVQFVSGGGFKAPYLSSSPASYNSEDNTNNDQSWTAGSNDVVPNHSSASYELSGTYMKSISTSAVDAIVASLQNRVLQGLDARAIDKIVSQAAYSAVTSAATFTYYAAALVLEEQLEQMTGYLFTKSAGSRAKQAKIDSGSGALVYKDGIVNGVAAATTSLLAGNKMIAGNFNHIQRYIWDGIEVSIMQDVAAKRKGNYILIADAFSDAVVTNPAAFALHGHTEYLKLS